MPLALLAALFAGLASAFVASQLRAVFYDAYSLRDAVGLPLLGVVTLVMGEGAALKERSELKKFLVGSGGLLVVFGAGMIAFSLISGRAG